jgi:26S proteasome regulatory subunit N2
MNSWYVLLDILWNLLILSAKAIDEYASFKSKAAESNDESTKVDPRLEAIVERLLDKYV